MPVTPTIEGDALAFHLGQLQPGERAALTYRVRIGANAIEGERVNTAVASGRFSSGETVTTLPAQATVRVGRGVFSMRQIILGRVYEDANDNGQFDKGEKPAAVCSLSGQRPVCHHRLSGNVQFPGGRRRRVRHLA